MESGLTHGERQEAQPPREERRVQIREGDGPGLASPPARAQELGAVLSTCPEGGRFWKGSRVVCPIGAGLRAVRSWPRRGEVDVARSSPGLVAGC